MADTAKILVVEDDRNLLDTIKYNLRKEGYAVVTAADGAKALETARAEKPDLIILDVMLPEVSGLEVCRILRKEMTTPVLMLTARVEETDKIVGLEIGADDYLPKTFSTRELLARLRAVTRRSTRASAKAEDAAEAEVVVGDLHINPGARTAVLGDQPLVLTPVEFELLISLARAKGRVKTREHLLDEIRDRNYEVFDRSIDVHISALRKKLGDDPKTPRYIRTVRAAGYMLINPAVE